MRKPEGLWKAVPNEHLGKITANRYGFACVSPLGSTSQDEIFIKKGCSATEQPKHFDLTEALYDFQGYFFAGFYCLIDCVYDDQVFQAFFAIYRHLGFFACQDDI